MPGSSNRTKKSKKKAYMSADRPEPPLETCPVTSPSTAAPAPPIPHDGSTISEDCDSNQAPSVAASSPARNEHADAPFIENRWNGPRAMDIRGFVESQYAARPSMDDPICAIFAVPEVRDMLIRVLPSETALILWYNKSRKSARICPACRRFYLTGDLLMPHLIDDQSRTEYVDPRNLREKEISGICSLTCFGIASYNWPGSIGAWGKWDLEIDPPTRFNMQGSGANIADEGMGAFMKLARNESLLELIDDTFRRGATLY